MTPGVRRLALTVHVVSSVGWLGAITVFLALGVVGATSGSSATARGAYLVMDQAARFVLVPLAFATLVTGIVQALGTAWGLLRHYWVVFKLLIAVVATLVLLAYLETFRALAAVAADPDAELASVQDPSPAVHAAAALVLLLVATVLGVYKPRGLTPYGRGRREPSQTVDPTTRQAEPRP